MPAPVPRHPCTALRTRVTRIAVVALLVALLVAAVAGCTAPTGPARTVVSAGDPPSHPLPVPTDAICAAALAPARAVMASHAYAADLDVEDLTALDAATAAAAGSCAPGDLDAFTRNELGVWLAAIPPTLSEPRAAPVSARCDRALGPWRERIARLGSTRADAGAQRARAALDAEGDCTPVERRLVAIVELEAALRRAGLAPRTASGPMPAAGRR